jgi:transposase InsO family protein
VVHRRHRAPTSEGKVYCCAVLDVFSRQVVGWSIADHVRAELVVDALQMATWRRQPNSSTIVHSDRGSVYTSWVFGHRLRQAGLLGSRGRVASSVDNSMIESFWSTMQRELLDTRRWATRPSWPARSSSGSRLGTTPAGGTQASECSAPWSSKPFSPGRIRGMITTPNVSGEPGQAPR